jgi:hypothetical protein
LCTVRVEPRRRIIKEDFEGPLAAIGVLEAVKHNSKVKVETEIKTILD